MLKFFSSPKLKQAISPNNYSEKLSACARSSLDPKKICMAAKEDQYVDTQKRLLPIKKKAAIITSDFSSTEQLDKNYASSIAKVSPHQGTTKKRLPQMKRRWPL